MESFRAIIDNYEKSYKDREIEYLRSLAYKRCVENRDYNKVDKIIDGIYKGNITKENLFCEVKKITRRVTSDHSISRWLILAEWFYNTYWFSFEK